MHETRPDFPALPYPGQPCPLADLWAGGGFGLYKTLLFNVVQYTLSVFNRWGQQVFASTEPMQGWDGTIRGTPQPDGAYVWYCRYQLQGEAVQTQRGTVLLIR
jgi:gliding motility-associated-like protein